MRWLRSFPMLVLLLAAGCTTVQQQGVSPALLLACPHPEVRSATNGDLARTINHYRWALTACNDDKAALRAGYTDIKD